jgi:hypothetical protein
MVKSACGERKVRLARGEKRNKKRMSTVGAAFTQKPNIRTPESVVESLFAESSKPHPNKRYHRPEQKRVWASLLLSKDAFIAQVHAEMQRRDPKHQKSWIVVTDGERALQRKVAATLPRIELVLDLLHVLEKLWAVSYVFHPEGSPEAREFVKERILRILRGAVSQVVKGLRQMVINVSSKDKDEQLCWPWQLITTETAPACATTRISLKATPSPVARSKELARTWSKTGWNVPGCAGPCPWPRRCCGCGPCTSQSISRSTGPSMLTKTRSASFSL